MVLLRDVVAHLVVVDLVGAQLVVNVNKIVDALVHFVVDPQKELKGVSTLVVLRKFCLARHFVLPPGLRMLSLSQLVRGLGAILVLQVEVDWRRQAGIAGALAVRHPSSWIVVVSFLVAGFGGLGLLERGALIDRGLRPARWPSWFAIFLRDFERL